MTGPRVDADSTMWDADDWNLVFYTLCVHHGCFDAAGSKVLAAAMAQDPRLFRNDGNDEFVARKYVEYLAASASTKIIHTPEMDSVAGNLLSLYIRYRVSRDDTARNPTERVPCPTDRPQDIIVELENHYNLIRTPATATFDSLCDSEILSSEFASKLEACGKSRVNELLLSTRYKEYDFNYMAVKTFWTVYLVRDAAGEPMETVLQALMRTALHIHGGDYAAVRRTYMDLCERRCTFATPIMVNAGRAGRCNTASCFLMGRARLDTVGDIYDTLRRVAKCLDDGGGVGLSLTHYNSTRYGGIIVLMKQINEVVNMLKHDGERRPGAVALYLEPWHPDVVDFVEARKNHGDERRRCRDVFTAVWVPDLFMRRVKDDGPWSLFDPEGEGASLLGLHGNDFELQYRRLEERGSYTARLDARVIWSKILKNQITNGTPYVLYKDSCIAKSNHRYLGPIDCANLCAEIVQYSDATHVATCKLASVCLPAFIDDQRPVILWDLMADTVENLVLSLNRLHDDDQGAAATASTLEGLEEHDSRSIGIGVQGLSDVFQTLGMYWGSNESRTLNKDIFEHLYFYALTASCRQAKDNGRTFDRFQDCTSLAAGVLQQDLWEIKSDETYRCSKLKWALLRSEIRRHGLYNSLLVALMPTATTSLITGCNESIEPYTTNMYLKRTSGGEFQCINRNLVRLLRSKGLYTTRVIKILQRENGSVRALGDVLSKHEMHVYRTAWEIDPHVIVAMAADRARYVDQSQSMNLYLENPTAEKLDNLHMDAWRRGLKTGMYYLRTRPAADPIKFTILPGTTSTTRPVVNEIIEPHNCVACSA